MIDRMTITSDDESTTPPPGQCATKKWRAGGPNAQNPWLANEKISAPWRLPSVSTPYSAYSPPKNLEKNIDSRYSYTHTMYKFNMQYTCSEHSKELSHYSRQQINRANI